MRSKLLITVILLTSTLTGLCQEENKAAHIEIYGQVMTDIGYNFNEIDSNWYDVLRPSKLPAYKKEFAPDGKIFFGVRQSRLGIQSIVPTRKDKIKAVFEFDLFGVGSNAGQTTFHIRQVYVEVAKFTLGQTESPFVDKDQSPDILDYWGAVGRPSLRNIQIQYRPVQGDNSIFISLEKPGASADEGIYAKRIELKNVRPEFILPDVTASYRRMSKWGYLRIAGLLKWVKWVDTGAGKYNLSGHALGWGLNLSTQVHLSDVDIFKGGLVYGQGIENYLTDGPDDIGIKKNFGNPITPVLGVALPVLGTLAFFEHSWNNQLSSTIGYSGVYICNSDAQASNAFRNGNFAIVNIRYSPVGGILVGAELQWGERENFNDGFSSTITKLQLSFKYKFSQSVSNNK